MSSAIHLRSGSGLRAEIENGSLRRLIHDNVMINLFPGNAVEGGPTNIYLRVLGEKTQAFPLLGAGNQVGLCPGGRSIRFEGQRDEMRFRLWLSLCDAAPVWFWHLELENLGESVLSCDLIHTQDVALADEGAIRLNEFYVSHYIDHTPLEHPQLGPLVASRQNQSTGGRFPWMLLGSLGHAVRFATDASQFHGLATRAGLEPVALSGQLPSERLQHEHAMVALQEASFTLAPGEKVARGFFGVFVPDHPSATAADDLPKAAQALELAKTTKPSFWKTSGSGQPSLFQSAPLLKSLECNDALLAGLFGCSRGERHVVAGLCEPGPGSQTPATTHTDLGYNFAEYEGGKLLCFFTEAGSHVVLQGKELMVLRPHGHLLRSGSSLVPDESALTSTAWMSGVFHSMVTQGHVSINRLLSTCHGYLGFFRSHGQRIFVELQGRWHLLDLPSAWEISTDRCRWIYRHEEGLIEITSSAGEQQHRLQLSIRVLEGAPTRFLITNHLAINGENRDVAQPAVEQTGDEIWVRANPDSDVGRRFPGGGFVFKSEALSSFGTDEMLFPDGRSRGAPFLCLVTRSANSAELMIEGRLVESGTDSREPATTGNNDSLFKRVVLRSDQSHAPAQLAAILPWFVHNALVHYLSPRGLEQYSGGGWGTRDVCQGPVELLLAHATFAPIRDILLRVFGQQNPDGDWPQWFMFFERERAIRPGDSHGDIVFWPVLALAQYLESTADSSLLDEKVPFFGSEEALSVRQHLECALALIRRRVIPGTRLAAYWHGDWNDSLQPVQPEMREKLCSAWTVTLHYQTLRTLARAIRHIGEPAEALEQEAAGIAGQFQKLLVADGVVAGLAYFRSPEPTLLLHPQDTETGLSYSLLPMIHAIVNDMFTPEQADRHLALIKEHLLGPDGARLFDRPLDYHGGCQRYFQRAESASYFGREIGLMYTHAHLRYCEALARHGNAEEFFEMLCRANPIALRELVPASAPRQANCYYSSSDARFPDRYAASADYAKAMRGEIPLEGGWRVYSSGAGIAVRLIKQCFLGVIELGDALLVDPVIAPSLNGLRAQLPIHGTQIDLLYKVEKRGCGPVSVLLNGQSLEFQREENRYRTGGIRIAASLFRAALQEKENRMEILLG